MGALSKIELSSNTSAKIGIASGSDTWVEEGPKATFLSGIDFSWADSSLSLFSILSEGRYDRSEDLNHPNIIDIVYSNSIFSQTEYSVELLFGWQRNVPETGTASWAGLVQYLKYQIDEKLSAKGRFEFFNDFDGSRTGFKGLYRALSAGITFSPEPWLHITPELRGDYIGSSAPFEGKHYVLTSVLGVTLVW